MRRIARSSTMKTLLSSLQRFSYALALLSFLLFGCGSDTEQQAGRPTSQDSVTMVVAEGKKPMRLVTDRPPNLETPLRYFREDFTPNDVFFVRWHLSNMPTAVNPDTFRLRVSGNVKAPLELSLDELKNEFEQVSVNALCVCAGNARSCLQPRVAGAQWVNGGMGNARWTGVRLKDVLAKAKADARSVSVAFNGMDDPPLETVPDFVKSLPFARANDGEVVIAYEMNGEPLPLLNGYPLKLVVPGWYATYWVGMLNDIRVYADTFHGYWMDKAYRVPKGVSNANESPDSLAKDLEPISRIAIRSIFVSPEPDSVLTKGTRYEMEGLAFDGGSGIARVEISTDDGKSWTETRLDPSLGNYSWRRWRFPYTPAAAGKLRMLVRATGVSGETQPLKHWNRSGYARNEIESIELTVR